MKPVAPPEREVHLCVRGTALTLEELTSRIGVIPDKVRRKGDIYLKMPRKFNIWQIAESGDSSADASQLLTRLFDRIEPIKESLRSLSRDDWDVKICVVQYMSAEDPTGPGFALELSMLETMSYIRAYLDVDLYA